MDALILADGDRPTRDELDTTWPGWDSAVGLVVAADGGARLAGPLGVAIDRWVGDGDSLPETEIAALEAAGIPLERTRPDKDESDTELAVAAALRLGADGVVVVGGLGGPRIDHALAKIDEGTFGICEECEEPISMKRLEARPETTLCIRCKEDQERIEKAYG
jgi:thiamine pyrophosphokinase